MEYAAIAFRVVVGSIFVLAAIAKLPRRRAFEAAVASYAIGPRAVSAVVARALPPFELVCGTLLLLGLATRVAAGLLAAALVVFAVAVAVNLARGRAIDCGCFTGAAPRTIAWGTVARNLALAALAAWVAVAEPRALALDATFAGGSRVSNGDAVAVAIAALVGLAAAGLVVEAVRVRRAILAPPRRSF